MDAFKRVAIKKVKGYEDEWFRRAAKKALRRYCRRQLKLEIKLKKLEEKDERD